MVKVLLNFHLLKNMFDLGQTRNGEERGIVSFWIHFLEIQKS